MNLPVNVGPFEIARSLSPLGIGILIFLVAMSVYSITVMLDRFLLLNKARGQSMRFVEAARRLLAEGRLDHLQAESRKHPQSHLARIYSAVIQDFSESFRTGSFTGSDDNLRGAAEREAMLVVQDFRRGLSGLASIGATAPFVGLLGTVIGIMNAFFGMARTGEGGIAAVGGGIAEALFCTAVGLFVALPAVWAFNYFVGRIERFNVEMSHAASELVDILIRNRESRTWTFREAGH